jgi:P pilus assembly chaperone PapD
MKMSSMNIANKTLTFATVFSLLFAAPAAYAGSLLFVAPNRIVFEPNQRTAVLHVTNKDSKTREFKIVLENYIMTESGSTQLVDDFEYSADRMLRYVPRRVKLAPGERQAVRIMARKPRDLADGDYHSHILFDEIPPVPPQVGEKKPKQQDGSKGQLKFKISALYSLALPVVVQHGKLNSELSIESANIKIRPDNGKYYANVKLNRKGNSEGNGFLTIEHTLPSGEVKMVGMGGDLHIYREADVVNRKFPVSIDESTPVEGLRAVLRTGPKPDDAVISSQPVQYLPPDKVSVEN